MVPLGRRRMCCLYREAACRALPILHFFEAWDSLALFDIWLPQAFKIYVLGCMGVYVSQAATNVFCGLCICCGCWLYTDKCVSYMSFPFANETGAFWSCNLATFAGDVQCVLCLSER